MTKPKKPIKDKGEAAAVAKLPNAAAPSQSEGRNFVQAWRLFRGIESQNKLAAMTMAHDPEGKGLERATINRLETGVARYHEDHVAILSRTLRVSPRDLIGTDPFNSGDVFAIYAGLNAADKRKFKKLLEGLKG